jgi:hypothetical protein
MTVDASRSCLGLATSGIGDPADSGGEGSPNRGHASGAARKSPMGNFAGTSFVSDHTISPISLLVL